MSDTPRTDAIWEKFGTDLRGELEPDVEFSTLARELNAANVEIEEKRKDVVWLATEKAKLEERIKRLEEAGDALENDNYTSDNLEAWRKSKEAKP